MVSDPTHEIGLSKESHKMMARNCFELWGMQNQRQMKGSQDCSLLLYTFHLHYLML